MTRKIGDTVKLAKGTVIGMYALRFDTDAKVTHIHKRNPQGGLAEPCDGSDFYRVEWIDIKGRTKTTYID